MVVRRNADPLCVQHIWNAIRYLNLNKQTPNTNKISQHLQKAHDYSSSQAELYIKQTLKDGLIIANQKSTTKSTPTTDSNEIYKIPTNEEPVLDGKDWYCFECHLAGDITLCKKCFRVVHPDCVSNARKRFDHFKKNISWYNDTGNSATGSETATINLTLEDENSGAENSTNNIGSTTTPRVRRRVTNPGQTVSYDNALCSVCNICRIDVGNPLDKAEINYLLKYVLHRIRAWLPSNITHTMAAEDRPEWLTESELTWRASQLFFEHSDMSVIEVNLNSETYGSFSEFLADVMTVQHNVAIFHGFESQEYGASELMMRDCLHDLAEIRNCPDCYKHSNEKINQKWFCLPCRQPHKLVWAKQKGYPYWPAKVIRETATHFDVRFFGGKYERSLLVRSLIKPITMTKEALQIKPSTAFNKAYEELKYHQKLLGDTDELQKLLASTKQKRNSISKQRNSLLNKSNSSRSNNSIAELNSTSEIQNSSPSVSNRSTKRKSSSVLEEESPQNKRVPQQVMSQIPSTSDENIAENVIDISDGEDDDDEEEYSYRQTFPLNNLESDATYGQVSSSTENYKQIDSADSVPQQLDHPYSDSVEKMRRKLLGLSEKKEIIKCAMECMQAEIDKITNDHNEYLKRLFESHNAQISETKKKQWCYNCEQDAIYHCCWNTAYCSQTCQQQHWQAEHKKVCRRKR